MHLLGIFARIVKSLYVILAVATSDVQHIENDAFCINK
jgi:hypothetical protein